MTHGKQRLQRQLVAAVTTARPDIPEAGRLVWSWFRALHDQRSYGFGAPNPISFAEIEAYARLYRLPIEPRHVDLIRAMDRAWLMGQAGKSAGAASPARPVATTFTPEIFDAVFG